MSDKIQELEEISSRIKKVQIVHNLKNIEMGEIMCISKDQYRRITRGENMVSIDKLILLCAKLGISLEYLLTGKNDCGEDNMYNEIVLNELHYRHLSNTVFDYVENLSRKEKMDKMAEMLTRFEELFDSIR